VEISQEPSTVKKILTKCPAEQSAHTSVAVVVANISATKLEGNNDIDNW